MTYIDAEAKLKSSMRESFGVQPSETIIDLFTLTRSIDWVITFTNYERSLGDIAEALPKPTIGFLNRLVTGLVARYEEFRTDTNANLALCSAIYESIEWSVRTQFKTVDGSEYAKLDETLVTGLLATSPNLIVLFMLSNMTPGSFKMEATREQ